MSNQILGFIGLGNMGNPMATHILKAGFDLVVHDRDKAAMATLVNAGATATASVAELAERADVVFLSLPTPDAVKSVVLGDQGLSQGGRVRVVVDLSTTGPEMVKELAEALAQRKIILIDCPISGGVAGAVNATLAVMASGDRQVLDDLAPALAALGQLFIVGDTPGQAQTMKIINNILSTAALTITSEAMVLGVKAGLDPDIMIDVLNAGTGRNSSTVDKVPNFVLPRSFDFGMAIGLSAKDARLCLEESDRLGVPMVVGNAVRQMLNITRDQFGPDVDMTSIIRVVEQWAGVEVRGAAAGKKPLDS
jgi:3-hydroxyisobutyrate dehydrogenase-like beta-hydroxyacid dehydrogenase